MPITVLAAAALAASYVSYGGRAEAQAGDQESSPEPET